MTEPTRRLPTPAERAARLAWALPQGPRLAVLVGDTVVAVRSPAGADRILGALVAGIERVVTAAVAAETKRCVALCTAAHDATAAAEAVAGDVGELEYEHMRGARERALELAHAVAAPVPPPDDAAEPELPPPAVAPPAMLEVEDDAGWWCAHSSDEAGAWAFGRSEAEVRAELEGRELDTLDANPAAAARARVQWKLDHGDVFIARCAIRVAWMNDSDALRAEPQAAWLGKYPL